MERTDKGATGMDAAETVTYLRRLQNPELMGGIQLFSGVGVDDIADILEYCSCTPASG